MCGFDGAAELSSSSGIATPSASAPRSTRRRASIANRVRLKKSARAPPRAGLGRRYAASHLHHSGGHGYGRRGRKPSVPTCSLSQQRDGKTPILGPPRLCRSRSRCSRPYAVCASPMGQNRIGGWHGVRWRDPSGTYAASSHKRSRSTDSVFRTRRKGGPPRSARPYRGKGLGRTRGLRPTAAKPCPKAHVPGLMRRSTDRQLEIQVDASARACGPPASPGPRLLSALVFPNAERRRRWRVFNLVSGPCAGWTSAVNRPRVRCCFFYKGNGGGAEGVRTSCFSAFQRLSTDVIPVA